MNLRMGIVPEVRGEAVKEAGFLLHMLLDKYENSALYKGTARSNRRVWLHFNRRNLPRYFDDSTARHKENINESARFLEGRGLVEIVWERFEEGNLIKKIALNLDHLREAYNFLGRRPREDKENRVAGLARQYARGAAPWVRDFLHYVADRVESGESVARYLDINDPDRAGALFKAVREAGLLGEETPRRVFSQRVLGSTKAFDAVAGSVARVAADFHPQFRETGGGGAVEPGAVLAELGIVDNPGHIFISGGLQFIINGKLIDVADFYPDLGISTELAGRMRVAAVTADYIITIENLTAFYSFIKINRGNFLAVYLGGYHNSLRRNFLRKIREHLDVTGISKPFYHWGDIDYGGFDIFVHLRDNCLADLRPVFMDINTLEKYRAFCLPFNDRYAEKLRKLLADPGYRVFHPVLAYMLQNGVRLEQECIEPYMK